MEYIRNRIGNTVLYRSRALETETGLKNIYLKMEGMNPTGRLQDRLAYALVKEAAQLGKKSICLASLGPLGSSVAYVSGLFEGIRCRIVIPEKSIEKKNVWFRQEHVEVIEYGKTYGDAFRKSSELAAENGWYDANPGYDNISISTVVYSEIAEEIVRKLGKNPDNLFVYLGDGALLLGLHHGFRALWLKGDIERIPKIYASCTSTNHKIAEAFKKGEKKVDEAYSRAVKKTKINRRNVNYKVVDAQGVLNSLYDSGGQIVSVDETSIKDAEHHIYDLEKIKTLPRGSLSYMALEEAVREGLIPEHSLNVVILEEGKTAIDVKRLYRDDVDSVDTIVKYTRKFLGEYGDSWDETKEAVEKAFKDGFVIGAFTENQISGIAVVIRMPLSKVLPEFHLVYIGADIKKGSKGIGSYLMKKITKLTKGDFSLHVDLDNKKAIRVYEKMGLKKSYIRMIYSNQDLVEI